MAKASYTITAYNRDTQTFTTLAHILAENSQDAKEKFIKQSKWKEETSENVSLIVQPPICR